MEVENSGQTRAGWLKRLLGLAELPPFGQHVLAGGELSLVNLPRKTNSWNYRSSVVSEQGTAHPEQDRGDTRPEPHPSPYPDVLGLQEHLDTISWQN